MCRRGGAGGSSGFTRANRCPRAPPAGASQRRDTAGGNFGGDGAYGVEITRGGNRKASFENVDTQSFQLASQLQFFGTVHRKTRRLFAVAQGGVENMNLIQAGS